MDLPGWGQGDDPADVSGGGQIGLLGDDGLQTAQGVRGKRRGTRPGQVNVQQHIE